MKLAFALFGCLALAGCASVAPRPTSYGIVMSSRLAQGQYMALHFSDSPGCFGEISSGKSLTCSSLAQAPRMVKVVWGPLSSWGGAGARDEAIPAGWKVPTHAYRQTFVALGSMVRPEWFRSGDAVVFTINRMHRLSISYVCREPAHAECTSFPPVTVVGEPQGAAVAAL